MAWGSATLEDDEPATPSQERDGAGGDGSAGQLGVQKLATVAEPPPSGPFVTWVEHDTALGLVDAEALVHAVSDLINPNSRSRDAYRNEGETSHV